ncbi:P1 family peptidase [Arthrobacter alpinus]|nr:P1 family peptidase [Arthrobacter alpinus]
MSQGATQGRTQGSTDVGSFGSITDVPGIRVGQAQRRTDGWLTGVSVVLPPPETIGSVDVRGGGPGTHETDALDPSTMVSTVDAVALTGGSAYGLAAAGECRDGAKRMAAASVCPVAWCPLFRRPPFSIWGVG